MPKNRTERERAEQYQSYMRGWGDGALLRGKRPEFTEHKTRLDLSIAYQLGYSAGAHDRDRAAKRALRSYNHSPKILRQQGVDSALGVTVP